VTGGCRKLHNEELHNLSSSPSITGIIKSRRIRWAGHVAQIEKKRDAYRILVGKPKGKRWEDQDILRCIILNLRDEGWGGMVDVELTLYRPWRPLG
jgi:hypothetical protein